MEISFAHKLEIGFIVLVLGIAGFLFFRNSRSPLDMTITSWNLQKSIAQDSTKPISPTNPVDPKRSYSITVFAFYDGKLSISEFAPESGLRAILSFTPDARRESYNLYKNPMDHIQKISDPYKRALTLAAYSAADDNPMGLLSAVRLDPAQRRTEREERQTMLDKVTQITEGAKTGTFNGELLDKLTNALNAYRAVDADPTKNPRKAKLAYDVVQLGLEYISKTREAKTEAAETYIKQIDQLLSDDQKVKLGEFGKQIADRRSGRRPVKAG